MFPFPSLKSVTVSLLAKSSINSEAVGSDFLCIFPLAFKLILVENVA